jgi:hypothetical protein
MLLFRVPRPESAYVVGLVLVVALLGLRASGQDLSRPVQRAGLGVTVSEVTPEIAREAGLDRPYGALVAGLSPDGAAARAGVMAGDVILEFDRKEIAAWGVLPTLLQSRQPGDTVHLKIWRQRQAVELDVVLAALAPAPLSPRSEATRTCIAQACPACQDSLLLLSSSADKACDACMKEKTREIASCVDAKVPPVGAGGTPASRSDPPGGRAGQPDAGLSFGVFYVRDVTLDPARVPPGGRFTIIVSYSSPSDRPVMFAFTISTGGRELFASKPEGIAGTSGTRRLYSRSLAAASDAGTYVIRVRLTYEGETQERSVTLTVAAS